MDIELVLWIAAGVSKEGWSPGMVFWGSVVGSVWASFLFVNWLIDRFKAWGWLKDPIQEKLEKHLDASEESDRKIAAIVEMQETQTEIVQTIYGLLTDTLTQEQLKKALESLGSVHSEVLRIGEWTPTPPTISVPRHWCQAGDLGNDVSAMRDKIIRMEHRVEELSRLEYSAAANISKMSLLLEQLASHLSK